MTLLPGAFVRLGCRPMLTAASSPTAPANTVPGSPAAPREGALRRQLVRGLKIAGLATGGRTVVDLAAQLALARLLAPEHFGVFAMAQALTGFVSCFSEVAGQKFLVREGEHPDPRTVASVFWFELLLASVVAALWMVACGPILAAMGHADQAVFAMVLCLWMVAERLMLPRALLDAELRFGATNASLFAGTVIGALAAVGTAALGAGAWALVVGLIGRTLASGAFLWYRSGWRPLPAFDRQVVANLVRFGAPLMGANALVFAYTNVDYVILAGTVGYGGLGLYYAAYRYPHYLNQFAVVLSSVVFPGLARAASDTQRRAGLGHLTRYCALLSFLPVVLVWTHGEMLVVWLIGAKWAEAAFAFQAFTLLAACRLTFRHWGDVAVAKGKTDLLLRISMWNLPVIALAALGGSLWAGIHGAAMLVTAASLASLAWCCVWHTPRLLPDFRYTPALKPALVAVLVATPVSFAPTMVPGLGAAWAAALGLLLGTGAYGAAVWTQVGAEALRLWRNR